MRDRLGFIFPSTNAMPLATRLLLPPNCNVITEPIPDTAPLISFGKNWRSKKLAQMFGFEPRISDDRSKCSDHGARATTTTMA